MKVRFEMVKSKEIKKASCVILNAAIKVLTFTKHNELLQFSQYHFKSLNITKTNLQRNRFKHL